MSVLKYKVWNTYKQLTILERIENRNKHWKSIPIYDCICSCWMKLKVSSSKMSNLWYCWVRGRHRKYEIVWNYINLEISSWEYTKIDLEDFDEVRKSCWVKTSHKSVSHNWYVHSNIKWKYIKLHQFVTWYNFVDHINRDTLDNRKSNLRQSNPKLNTQNTKRNINFTYKWETKCLQEWSNILWINRETLRYNYHLWKHFELIAKSHWLIYKWIDLD